MFKRASITEELATAMEHNLIESANVDVEKNKRLEAAQYIQEASDIFNNVKLKKQAKIANELSLQVLGKKKPSKIEQEVWKHYGNISYADDMGPKDKYHPTHEGPGEAAREHIEDEYLNSILNEELGEKPSIFEEEFDKYNEDDELEVSDINDELFEDE